eukprot:269942-Amphidinium_carterae.1
MAFRHYGLHIIGKDKAIVPRKERAANPSSVFAALSDSESPSQSVEWMVPTCGTVGQSIYIRARTCSLPLTGQGYQVQLEGEIVRLSQEGLTGMVMREHRPCQKRRDTGAAPSSSSVFIEPSCGLSEEGGQTESQALYQEMFGGMGPVFSTMLL